MEGSSETTTGLCNFLWCGTSGQPQQLLWIQLRQLRDLNQFPHGQSTFPMGTFT
jgi:hypothetical protein